MKMFSILLATCLMLALAGSAFADADDSGTSSNPDFVDGVKAVKAQDFKGAIALFTKVVADEPKNADAYNYMGYSYRKLGDLDAALKNYNTALSIKPDHLGANEYLGETYLLMGDVPKAKGQLAKLDKICWLGCAEFTDLKNAIHAYEAQHQS